MSEKIALALSGGGSRAIAFHAGVLRYLAEKGLLEQVCEISSVSGGSLLTGLIFTRAGMRWPGSQQYLAEVLPAIRSTLVNSNIQASALARLLYPGNWRYFSSRPNLVARAIYVDWKVRGTLGDLPTLPVWSINGTTAENGRRFRFKGSELGDGGSGYAEAAKFPLASAMAVSAAFPVGIGPFTLFAKNLSWQEKDFKTRTSKPVKAPYDDLHLYDGGLYDNLGLEPFFDTGKLKPRGPYRIIVADAGAPLTKGFGMAALNPFRIKRLMDVMMNQNRALRVRGFVSYLEQKEQGGGAYLGIVRSKNICDVVARQGANAGYLSDDVAERVANFPTSLSGLSGEDFDLIAQHGYESAKLTQLGYPYC